MIKLFRSAFRNKGLTIINIVGLTLAITVALFLTSYLKYEFSFDKDFEDADRIFRPVFMSLYPLRHIIFAHEIVEK